MRKFFTALGVILHGAAIAAQNTSTSNNYRPSNVRANLSDLYIWVGSYYNATAQVDFIPYGGLAASIPSNCPPAFSNQTASGHYSARLAITEPSSYDSSDDLANVFLTLWPLDYNFTKVLSGQPIRWMPDLDFGLFSSEPLYGGGTPMNNWIWSLKNTTSLPYNMSSNIMGRYEGFGELMVNASTPCVETSQWSFLIWSDPVNGTNLTNPTIDLQFDDSTANLTLQGYAEAGAVYGTEPFTTSGSTVVWGEFSLTLSGVIDKYHSDVLRNDTNTPTWLPTVGYNNNSANIGYTTQSTGSRIAEPLLLTTIVFTLWLIIC